MMARVKVPDSKMQKAQSKKRIRQSVHHIAMSADLRISIPLGKSVTIMDGQQRLLALRRLMNETPSSIEPEFGRKFVGENQY